MAQWVNCLWNNIFVNLLPPLSCEIFGVLHLVQLGLAGREEGREGGREGRQASRQAGRQTKYRLILKISKLVVG